MKIARLGVLVVSVLFAVLGSVGCSNPAGSSAAKTHSWYYTVSVTTGTQAYVESCINSTGGQDTPGTVTTPWTSSTYATPSSGANPEVLLVSAWLPTGVTGSITANIYEDGNQVATQTASGTGAMVEPTHAP